MELINILIRTGLPTRKELFNRCLNSIYSQSYSRVRIIVSIDRDCDYVDNWHMDYSGMMREIEIVNVFPDKTLSYPYDCYLNELKELVTDGYVFVLDDDDILAPGCLNKLDLSYPAILVQINHLGRITPINSNITIGNIGMPCLVLHHSLKHLAYYSGADHGDYHYAKEIASKIDFNFQELVLVECNNKGNGI